MEAKLDIAVEGKRGSGLRDKEDIGRVIAFLDGSSNKISVDAFEGSGDDLRRRERCHITIRFEYGKTWEGDIDQLREILEAEPEAFGFGLGDVESHIDTMNENLDDDEDEIELTQEEMREVLYWMQRDGELTDSDWARVEYGIKKVLELREQKVD